MGQPLLHLLNHYASQARNNIMTNIKTCKECGKDCSVDVNDTVSHFFSGLCKQHEGRMFSDLLVVKGEQYANAEENF